MWCKANNCNDTLHVQKNFCILTFIKQLLTKYQIFTKLRQISQISKNRTFYAKLEIDRSIIASTL